MDTRSEIREFLTSRRARLNAADVGLPNYGARRVPGLRREEVAVLAGVSVPDYTRLERSDVAGVSDGVLDALARALQLDDAERSLLFDLARAVQPLAPPPRRRPAKDRIRASVQHVLEAITGAAALLLNDRHDILAANALSRALFPELLDGQERPNFARSSSSTRAPATFISTGTTSLATSPPPCARPPDASPTTAPSPTSSASSRPAATSSAASGPATTSASTTAGSSVCTTRRSATWSSATRASRSCPIPA
jgi:transcriptional regulator with XRE-family HTH domain